MNMFLSENGYLKGWHKIIADPSTDFFAGLIKPDKNSDSYYSGLLPVIVFRGTNPEKLRDWLENAHPTAVGKRQFEVNRTSIRSLITQAGGLVDVTGHSLGGSLAQQAAVAFSDSVQRVITFQAPGIDASAVQQLKDSPEKPEVTHHFARGDIVDDSGQQHLPGEIYLHGELADPYTAHTNKNLIAENDKRERLSAEEYRNHSLMKRIFLESLRTEVGHSLAVSLIDRVELIRKVDQTSEVELANSTLIQRSAMVHRLLKGLTLDTSERAILKLLRASRRAGDLVQIIDTVDAHRLADKLDGKEGEQLRELLRKHYYPHINQNDAFKLICLCIDGHTAEWEQEMIADLLTNCPPEMSRDLIEQIGLHYRKQRTLNAGLFELDDHLDGADWGRVVAKHGLPW
jgi:uncharacterized protein YnzC (UPF0291/DUF896 family)